MGHKTDLWDKGKYLCSKHSRNETPLEIEKIISSEVFEDRGQHQNRSDEFKFKILYQ